MQQRAYKMNVCEARARCDGVEVPVEERAVVKEQERSDERPRSYSERSRFWMREFGTAGLGEPVGHPKERN